MLDDTPHWAQLRQLCEAMLRMERSPARFTSDFKSAIEVWRGHVDRIAEELEQNWLVERGRANRWWRRAWRCVLRRIA